MAVDESENVLGGAIYKTYHLSGFTELLTLVVKSDCQGMGLGTSLLAYLICRETNPKIQVCVTQPCHKFFAQFGFRVIH